ncbi:23S rRNA pseudouridine2605 synthase [Anaerospora hongkongensis]|uniref:Pseudouridine synthase n=1 Tax=Anaerospora hongkongensis TaxID=244830 RepID=A0A4R1Q659_9FIRM|nr:pseudouridine synthase [Anaerospora hongkongensis]TCL40056.1 23S rRNA pseudouridine2605 synthase [Anaerospora hongkongensis]
MPERLQKVISQAGIASRRESEELIKAGRVKVNGVVVTELGTKVEPTRDKVAVDNKPIRTEKSVYILLNKPRGIVTTLHDPEGRKTVASLLPDISERIYPVGRLDYNTEGLLLMTNDGELTHALTHPSHEIDKTYRAKVLGRPPEEKLDRLRAGIKLEDGLTAPAKVNAVEYDREKDLTTVEIVITEGRNRQVRRMFEAIGHPVRQLKRVKFAFLTLVGVRRGAYRHLEADEVETLKNIALKK